VTWDARKIDDRTYHRRRLIITAFTSLSSVGLGGLRLSDIADRGWQLKDWLAAGYAFMAVYFGRMAVLEFQLMRQATVPEGRR